MLVSVLRQRLQLVTVDIQVRGVYLSSAIFGLALAFLRPLELIGQSPDGIVVITRTISISDDLVHTTLAQAPSLGETFSVPASAEESSLELIRGDRNQLFNIGDVCGSFIGSLHSGPISVECVSDDLVYLAVAHLTPFR